jgi:hypothetical protein
MTGSLGGSRITIAAANELADLDRFASFLLEQSPELAAIVAEEIIAKAQVLSLTNITAALRCSQHRSQIPDHL